MPNNSVEYFFDILMENDGLHSDILNFSNLFLKGFRLKVTAIQSCEVSVANVAIWVGATARSEAR